MMITALMVMLLVSGCIAWALEGKIKHSAKWVSITAITLSLVAFVAFLADNHMNLQQLNVVERLSWISTFSIEYALGLDYLSALMIALTLFLGSVCVLVSWQEIEYKSGFYYFNLLAAIAGIIGVFTAIDLFLFFFFWEVMLLPMTALIAIWGHENRKFAAIKFFIFTQLSSLLMLAAIIGMAYGYYKEMGQWSFFYLDWLTLDRSTDHTYWLMLGFFIAFAVKLPSIPVHSWLPDAHTQAPTAGSVLLAGVLLKTGAYGLIRFVIVLFPQASSEFAVIAIPLGVCSVLYGAKLAFAQSDIKRMIAYSSISHMGFVMLALFSFNDIAYQGAIMTLVAHGLSSGALFALAGMLYFRVHSRALSAMGGLWQSAPRLGGFALIFAAAAFGLPGLANFIGEFLSLVGVFYQHPYYASIAALGLIGSAIYGMVLFQSSFHGKVHVDVVDISPREFIILGSLFLLLLILGLFPALVLTHIPRLSDLVYIHENSLHLPPLLNRNC